LQAVSRFTGRPELGEVKCENAEENQFIFGGLPSRLERPRRRENRIVSKRHQTIPTYRGYTAWREHGMAGGTNVHKAVEEEHPSWWKAIEAVLVDGQTGV